MQKGISMSEHLPIGKGFTIDKPLHTQRENFEIKLEGEEENDAALDLIYQRRQTS